MKILNESWSRIARDFRRPKYHDFSLDTLLRFSLSFFCWEFQVVMYSQVLWQIVADEYGGSQYLMNGAIESISTITGKLIIIFSNHIIHFIQPGISAGFPSGKWNIQMSLGNRHRIITCFRFTGSAFTPFPRN